MFVLTFSTLVVQALLPSFSVVQTVHAQVSVPLATPKGTTEITPLTKKFVLEAKKIGVPDVTGRRISTPFKVNGKNLIAYENILLIEESDGSIKKLTSTKQLQTDTKQITDTFPIIATSEAIGTDQSQNQMTTLLTYLEAFTEGKQASESATIKNNTTLLLNLVNAPPVNTQKPKDQKTLPIGQVVMKLGIIPMDNLLSTPMLDEQVVEDPPVVQVAQTPINTPSPIQTKPVSYTQRAVAAVSQAVSYPAGSITAIVSWAASQMGIPESYAHQIVRCESGYNPAAMNPSGARGLWQLMPSHASKFAAHGWNYWTDWTDPYKNTVIAIEVMRGSGPRAWSCA